VVLVSFQTATLAATLRPVGNNLPRLRSPLTTRCLCSLPLPSLPLPLPLPCMSMTTTPRYSCVVRPALACIAHGHWRIGEPPPACGRRLRVVCPRPKKRRFSCRALFLTRETGRHARTVSAATERETGRYRHGNCTRIDILVLLVSSN
jgi:hypothetical protein